MRSAVGVSDSVADVLRGLTALVVLTLGVAACGGGGPDAHKQESDGDVAIPLSTNDWHEGDFSMAAGMDGVLSLSEDGCVFVTNEANVAFDVLWPAGYTAVRHEDGTVALVDDQGVEAAVIGDEVRLGGGSTAGDAKALVCQAGDGTTFSVNGPVHAETPE